MDGVHSRIISFERLCRLCLQEKRILMNIYDSVDDNYNLGIYEKIMACAKIALSKGDGLPTTICVPCLSSLNAAFEFRLQCENADKTLHDIYQILISSQYEKEKEEEESCEIVEVEDNNEFTENQFQNLDLKRVIVIKREDPISHEDVLCNYEEKKEEKEVSDLLYVTNFPKKNKGFKDNIIEIKTNNQIISNSHSDILTVQSKRNSNEIFLQKEDHSKNLPEEKEIEKKSKKVISEGKKSSCPFCKKVLTRVNEHIRLLHRNKVYICKNQNCGAEFSTLKNLQSHQLKCYNMEKQYKCMRCFKEFYRKCNYKAHIRRHSDRKDFQCQLCEKAFVDSTGLRRHFLKHHEPQQEIYVVGCCGKKFKTKKGLKQHIERGVCGVQVFQTLDSSDAKT